jgi:heterodisulfide reductase subunit A-like polyferredoxin
LRFRDGIAKLKWVEPEPVPTIEVIQKALVIGGGIAGMMAALAIAGQGTHFQIEIPKNKAHIINRKRHKNV